MQDSGVSEAWCHIIHGILTNPQRTELQNRTIKSLCRRVAGADAEGLYRFLTDLYIDHNYIFEEYLIRPNNLYRYRAKFYREFPKRLTSRKNLLYQEAGM
ncbi:MAG: hypothetical protein J1G06_09850 [Oscillospiraceae bacterium]|nr:hypothetical protein [Oscillospiraceae bacterium]